MLRMPTSYKHSMFGAISENAQNTVLIPSQNSFIDFFFLLNEIQASNCPD